MEGPPGFMNASQLESEAMELTGFVAVELDPLSMLRQDQKCFRTPMTMIDDEMAYGYGDRGIQPATRLTILGLNKG
jgi:hypothetical protein